MNGVTPGGNQIKPWPELIGWMPSLLCSYDAARDAINKKTFSSIHLDLSQLQQFDVIGLSVFFVHSCKN